MQQDIDTGTPLLEGYRERLRKLDALTEQAFVTSDAKQIEEALLCMDELSIYWSAVRKRLVSRWRDIKG